MISSIISIICIISIISIGKPGLHKQAGRLFIGLIFVLTALDAHAQSPDSPAAPRAPGAPTKPVLSPIIGKAPVIPRAPKTPQKTINTKSGNTSESSSVSQSPPEDMDQHQARWDPIHFKPEIDKATNEQCLGCHADVLKDRVLDQSPAGVKANEALAWYQTLDTYEGKQLSFHQRHFTSKLAKELMDLKCNTCHQGHDPGVELSYLVQSGQVKQKIRKLVDPDICLMCHGKFDAKTMPGLAGDWVQVRDTYKNDCLVCHELFRTNRHQVNYLNPDAIEKAGEKSGDSCYGCHGGRAWYRTSYPYPRHKWPGMSLLEPDWAKKRPTESDARFLQGFDPFKEKKRIQKQIMQKLEEIEVLKDSMK